LTDRFTNPSFGVEFLLSVKFGLAKHATWNFLQKSPVSFGGVATIEPASFDPLRLR
jgi:hypothetical protein